MRKVNRWTQGPNVEELAMKLKLLAAALALTAAGFLLFLPAEAQGPAAKTGAPRLTLKVMTAGDNGYATTSTIISGERDAIIIDPQFTKSEAMKVAAAVKASGKNLTVVYSTHGHPDHYFGLATLREEFPEARFRALPEVVPNIERGWPARREFWYPAFGEELPSAKPVLPQGLARPELELEGEVFPITGPVYGDGPGNTFVWIPSLRAVVAGDIIFNQCHFDPPADPAPLYETFDKIMALNPAMIIGGHEKTGVNHDPGVIQWMKTYISDFQSFRASSSNAAELKQKMLAKYPGLAMETLLENAVNAAFPAAGKGKAK
jgi:glyoxylase-like metal-dependent hydrolase (beta-lactamase superfamily II)